MDDVEIVTYDPRWPALLYEEAKRLGATFDPPLIVGLEHFGSTSVRDSAAKPIMDILIASDHWRTRKPALSKPFDILTTSTGPTIRSRNKCSLLKACRPLDQAPSP
jgi:GrpB-like predicted nucleotidyltransferase (UPF0157 family)